MICGSSATDAPSVCLCTTYCPGKMLKTQQAVKERHLRAATVSAGTAMTLQAGQEQRLYQCCWHTLNSTLKLLPSSARCPKGCCLARHSYRMHPRLYTSAASSTRLQAEHTGGGVSGPPCCLGADVYIFAAKSLQKVGAIHQQATGTVANSGWQQMARMHGLLS